MKGRTEGMLSSQDGAAVICSGCGERVDLSSPLPREGWQVAHACLGQTIEVLAIHAGEQPWAWQARATKD